jgi:hypothetical protein
MKDVSITIPAEHAEAVREDMLDELERVADHLRGQAAKVEFLVENLRRGLGSPEPRLETFRPGDRARLRTWAEDAKRDGEETLADINTYFEPDRWEQRSRSLLAVSGRVLEEVGG